MFTLFWHTVFYDPIYNALVFLISVAPSADVGIAIVLLTILVRLVLLPLSLKAARAQRALQRLQPEITRIREKFKSREEQARQMMAFYREHKVRPFSSFLLVLLQLPFIFALYFVFANGGLPEVNFNLLYSFTPVPASVNMEFFSLVLISEKSVVLALLAGLTQYIQLKLSIPPPKPRSTIPSFQEEFTRSFQQSARYSLPLMVFALTYFFFSAAVALYWTVSNLVSIGQELVVRRQALHEDHGPERHSTAH